MKIGELRAEAAARGVDIHGLRKKEDIIAALENATVQVSAEIIEDETEETAFLTRCEAGTLSANFDALRARVTSILADYEGWEPDPDNPEDVKQCTVHRKYLRGIAKEIDDRRKDVKREFLRPLELFEQECNSIRDQVKEAADKIAAVEKEADEKRRFERENALQEDYMAYAGVLVDVVPFAKIFDPKWLNKGTSYDKAREAMEHQVNSITSDWESLKAIRLENQSVAEAHFFEHLDLGAAIAHANEQLAAQKRIADMKAQIAPVPMPEPVSEYTPEPVPECVSEHVPECAPEPVPMVTPQQPATNKPADVTYNYAPLDIGTLAKQLPPEKQQTLLEALQMLLSPKQQEPAVPRVMIVQAATHSQLVTAGKFCGICGVTGTFRSGTPLEICRADYPHLFNDMQGQVFAYGS